METAKTIKKLIEIGTALSAETDKQKLLQKILERAKELTDADGGTLYTITADKKLCFEIVRTDSLGISWERAKGEKTEFPDIPLFDADGKPNDKTVVACAVNHDRPISVVDAYEEKGFDFSGTKKFDERTGYRSKSFLAVPLKNHEGDIIGVLQLLNARKGQPFTQEEAELVQSLASQAAVAMTNQRLIEELRYMFESLTRVIAEAIDEKSPITGKHCKRVPIIAQMIAEAVNEVHEGPLKEIKFTKEDLYELDIAALLHDCGKVTTPVHVVEKGKKLETIIDRIVLFDTRCEIIRRDLEKKFLIKQISQQEYDAEVKKLQADRVFIHGANLGKEMMSPEDLERIKQVAARTWVDLQGAIQPLLTEDEVKNLSIVKGTLTEEERRVIQNHVVMTIRMLEKIPYPKYLRAVPEIAGRHHERIDGKGYPLGITGKEMSVRAKILCIADIFEALTAPDRPYKEVMTLARAIKILNNMRDEGHIDKELWDIFLNKKVYMRYAKQYLLPQQLDMQ